MTQAQQHDNVNKNKIYDMLGEILKHNVSDIHMAEDRNVYVRNSSWRIVPLENIFVSKDEIWWFMHDILKEDKVDILLGGTEVDISYKIQDTYIRINAYLDRNWIRLAIRRIPSKIPALSDIWLDDTVKEFLSKDKWLILVTGSTWSWKSTTLAAMLDYINENRRAHIITLEDPIEYVFENKKSLITQREVWKNTKSWNDAMKYAMRQDPDIIMVWEMRDVETISAVLSLVETWHLVLSTLHTVDAAQTITRIIDVFPSAKQDQVAIQLSLSLEYIISQRLLPMKEWKWRVAVRDILVNTQAVANNIRQRKVPQITSIMETWFRYWMKTMDQSMAEAVAKWLVDLDVVLPRIKNQETFNILLQSYKNGKGWFDPID